MLEVEIQVRGHINKDWSNSFGYLAVTHGNDGNTTFSGSIRDQSALRGVLSFLADLGLDLISVDTKYEITSGISRKEGDLYKRTVK